MFNKKTYMWLCVAGVAAGIFGIWIASITFDFGSSAFKAAKSAKAGVDYFNEVKNTLKKQTEAIRPNDGAKNAADNAATSTEAATSTIMSDALRSLQSLMATGTTSTANTNQNN
jgi:hypothetical protein